MAQKLYIQNRLYNVNDRLASLNVYEKVVEWINDGTLVDMELPYLPFKSSNNSGMEDEAQIFAADVGSLKGCTAVSGFFDGWTLDPGCGFEIGAGYAWGYPIHLVSTDIFQSSVGNSSEYYHGSKLVDTISKFSYVSNLNQNIGDYRERNEDVLTRALEALRKSLISDFGSVHSLPTAIGALPIKYDYYIDPNFKYTESGRLLLRKITTAIVKMGKTYVQGDNQGDIVADLENLRSSKQAILMFDVAEPNIDSAILGGIAYGIDRKPIVYASNEQRIFMSDKWRIQLNTMNHYSAMTVVHSISELFEFMGALVEPDLSLDDMVKTAAIQAIQANCQGTFGVGGLLMKTNGTVIHQMHNNVVLGGKVNDPTAHGERQLIDWYFENKTTLHLPEPEDIVLVTSLDPCCMCAGACLQAGFKRVVVAANDTYAGINYKKDVNYPTLSGTPMLNQIKKMFTYPAVNGDSCYTRKKSGADVSTLFNPNVIQETTQALCDTIFTSTEVAVQDKINAGAKNPSLLTDLSTLEESHPVRKYLAEKFGKYFLAYRCPERYVGQPGVELADVVYKDKPFFTGVLFFDNFGNLLFGIKASDTISTQSAFMKATRLYADVRKAGLIDGTYDIHNYLCHPKYGYFISTFCPEVNAQALMDLGAFGSTMEGLSENPIQHILLDQERGRQYETFASQFPPLYTEKIKIKTKRVDNSFLVSKVYTYYEANR